MKIKVKEITGDEINEYYAYLRARGLKGTSCQRHHSLLHLAFKSAMKRRIIPTNPIDQADRPKSVQFIGNYYDAEEIKQLIDCTKDDPLHIVIVIAAYYGLRRSEVIGLKWSAVDFVGKTISIKHKVSPIKAARWSPIGKNRVYKLIHSGELRSFVYQGGYILSKDDLIDYLLEHCDDEPARSIKRGGKNE